MKPQANAPRRRAAWLPCAIAITAAAALTIGSQQMAFFCDDAFITFRFVANAHDGHGLVWNPPPFAPVEGYTSFLWAVLLWAAWTLTGQPPTVTANALALLCSLALLAVTLAFLWRGAAASSRGLVWLGMLMIASNRSFVSWTSSGLDAALFQAVFVGWVLCAFTWSRRSGRGWWTAWALVAALAALTRPDGFVCLGATGVAAAAAVARRQLVPRDAAASLLPFLLVAGHLVWRRSFYGSWLPNTYYAKVVEPWPDAGSRYLGCFVLEHGTWLWAGLLVLWSVRASRARHAARPVLAVRALAIAAVVAHAAYYTLVVGGDHFEYRVLAHLVPLTVVSGVWFLCRTSTGLVRWSLALLFAAATSIGWVHLALTAEAGDRCFVAVADRLPEPLRPVARVFDRWQAYLRVRLIGLRCQDHAAFFEHMRSQLPEQRIAVDPTDLPVYHGHAIGWQGWALRDVAILDHYGLCERIVARTKRPAGRPPLSDHQVRCMFLVADLDRDGRLDRVELDAIVARSVGRDHLQQVLFKADVILALGRRAEPWLDRAQFARVWPAFGDGRCMAHERNPPAGYFEEFDPNVEVGTAKVVVHKRARPLTAVRVRAIESKWQALAATTTLLTARDLSQAAVRSGPQAMR